jgi:hypothetical protein
MKTIYKQSIRNESIFSLFLTIFIGDIVCFDSTYVHL